MAGEYVVYLNRTVPKEGFRAFVYGFNGVEKLAESWDEYEKYVSSGSWFPTKASVPSKRPLEKSKK